MVVKDMQAMIKWLFKPLQKNVVNHFIGVACKRTKTIFDNKCPGGGGLPEKLGGGVRLASQNPYPIYDQNLWFSPTLFMIWPKIQYPI